MAEGLGDHIDPVLGPVSEETAALLRRYPISKPANADRKLEVRGGRVVEIVSDAAFIAIKTYLDGGEVEMADTDSTETGS
ncbi:MAG: hypothetical protein JWM34_466 [Ilumatobacteraceae bacterium]|nr:hypothetical protein [Ilumatobacteraceae bacterium]